MNHKADVLLVTATDVECRAVMAVVAEATGRDSAPVAVDGRTYLDLGEVNGASVFLALTAKGTGGVGGSQESVGKGISALAPAAVIMVGIAFGINEARQEIGDVLVSEQLMLYEMQRIGTGQDGGFEIIPRGDRPHASQSLINRLRLANIKKADSQVEARFGLVLSGEKLVDHVDFRTQLLGFEPEAIGGEMEGAGLYVACQDQKVDWVVVKSICDWADGKKRKNKRARQERAAHNAAAFVLHALQQTPFKSERGSSDYQTQARPAELNPTAAPAERTRAAAGRTRGLTPRQRGLSLTSIPWADRNKEATDYFTRISEGLRDDEDKLLRMLQSWGLARFSKTGAFLSIAGALLFGPSEMLPDGIYTDVQIEDRRHNPPRIRNFYGQCLSALIEGLSDSLADLWQERWEDPSRRDSAGRPIRVPDYPQLAITEAVINFAIHRDYSVQDQAYVVIGAEYVEFTNPGTSAYSVQELLTSKEPLRPKYQRNPLIIGALSRTSLCQRQGGGIIRMREALTQNGNLAADGSPGLEIRSDELKDRFTLRMLRCGFGSPDLARPRSTAVSRSSLPVQSSFFGRQDALAVIAEAISPEARTWGALIDGPGGIGKTALAVRAGHLAPNDQFDRKVFLSAKIRDLTPAGEQPLEDFMLPNYLALLTELARELDVEDIAEMDPSERANAVRRALANVRALIVIDNVETLPEVDRARLYRFLSRLPAASKAIVTSRRRTDVDARVIRLDKLEREDALNLMSALSKNNRYLERSTYQERVDLYELTNGNPLLMTWTVAQLGREGSRCRTIAEACAFLRTTPKGNDPLEYVFGDLVGTFTESETAVLAALTHFTEPARLGWIAEVARLTESAARTALEDLSDRALVMSDDRVESFVLPPLAATYLRRKRPDAIYKTQGRTPRRLKARSAPDDASSQDDAAEPSEPGPAEPSANEERPR